MKLTRPLLLTLLAASLLAFANPADHGTTAGHYSILTKITQVRADSICISTNCSGPRGPAVCHRKVCDPRFIPPSNKELPPHHYPWDGRSDSG